MLPQPPALKIVQQVTKVQQRRGEQRDFKNLTNVKIGVKMAEKKNLAKQQLAIGN